MYLARLRIRGFRCFEAADLTPTAGVNVITGDNASGKTSLLEAVYFLGRGQSFRRSAARPAIRRGADGFTVHGEVASPGQRTVRLGVYRTPGGMTYKCDEQARTTRLDLVNTLPLQLIDPNLHRLLEQGPRYRRHFLDWGVFHVEHAFFPAWRRYRRALRQRNRALKSRQPRKDIVAWDAELVHNGEVVDAARRAYIDAIRDRLSASTQRLLGDEAVAIRYAAGWRGEDGFGPALAAGLERDIRAGVTQQGPHRADLRVAVASATARDWVSRGQQKVLTAALLLVQAELLYSRRGLAPVLLIDDLAAELGATYRERLAREIRALGGQAFVTFLDSGHIPSSLAPDAMFHVERGCVRPL